ncbi:MAG: chromosome segregation protein SMC [Desulfomonilaceae bacterium]
MRLSKLEIKGFKSFPDKTVLEFRRGITGVVGPNGCGKSNILEAIRWVMGEQRPRTLRGARMGDVIFNGSETRRPVGMAEVRMTLEVDPRYCPPALRDYDEVMVARRLFRDGESQYEINMAPCRLSDVVDLFLDTGLTQNSYAILEQGRVEMVVNSKPEDRRWLIEEAAGITRYKMRKETATKRLEQTQTNLERLRDVLIEVNRQATALRKQARKAERYRHLRDRLRSLELAWNASECKKLSTQIEEGEAELSRLRDSLIQLQSRSALEGGALQRDRQALADMDKRTIELHERQHTLEMAMEAARVDAARSREKLTHLQSQRQRLLSDQQEKGVLRDQCARRVQETQETVSALAAQILQKKETLKKASEALERFRADSAEVQERIEAIKTSLFQALQTCAAKRNEREAAQRRIHEIEVRQSRIAEESRRAEAQAAASSARLGALQVALEEARTRRQQAIEQKNELLKRLKERQDVLQGLRDKIRGLETEHARITSRLTSLEELDKSGAHYDQSVQYMMAQREHWPEGSLIGPLPDFIEVTPGYEKALAAVLERRIGSLIVSSPSDAAWGVEMLRQSDQGRATFVPRIPRGSVASSPPQSDPGLTNLSDVVRFAEGFEELGRHLVGRCVVVENLSEALRLWSRNGAPWDVATVEGDFLDHTGELTGGSWNRKTDKVFSLRREIGELRNAKESLEKTLEAHRAQFSSVERAYEETMEGKTRAEEAAAELRVEEINKANEIEKLQGLVAALHRKTRTMGLEIQTLDKEKISLTDAAAAFQTEIEELERTIRELKEHTTACRIESEDLTRQREALARRHADIQVEVAKLEERHASTTQELERNKQLYAQLESQLKALEQELEANATETEAVKEKLRNAEDDEKVRMLSHKDCSEQLATLGRERESLTQKIREIEALAAASSSQEKTLQGQIHEREIELVQLKQTLQHLAHNMIERYGVDPTAIVPENCAVDQNEIEQARKQIDELGDVNLSAVREYQDVQERLTFLRAQESDLKEAMQSLHDTIGKITTTTNELFMNTFDAINEKFQEMFSFLFQGGEASLELVGSENVLEAGVDIVARPPGKKRQAMGLLSGGEKALTAIALIFAIFLTRPSPFCLLDEVDAPLDDANISRFNDMLRSLSDKTQFIVITHNRRTMEVADCLYGITMEEPGVSSIVSVDLAR